MALGITVDDTIHFLSSYKDKRAENHSVPEALRIVLETKGRGILAACMILSFGFGVLMLSRFVPTAQFGMLCAIIMCTALVGDMIIMPSILLLNKENKNMVKGKK